MSGIGYGLVLFQFVRQLLSAAPAVGFYFIERPVVRILLLAIPPVSANAIFTRIYRTNLRFRNYLFITRPMLVPPRPYPPFSCEFNASTVIPGGLLGNGLYFHVLLYRPVSSSSHRLWLQPEVLRGLNNVQHIPYYIDNELLILFQHHFSLLPGFLEARTRRHYITRLVILRRRIHALFVDRDNLERSSQLQYCHRRRA